MTTTAPAPVGTSAGIDQRDLVLPFPPTDHEKHAYVSRQLSVIVVASMLSLACLSVSQLHLLRLSAWLWGLVPFLVFTVCYYLISLRVNLFSRNFDLRTHRALVQSWDPVSHPSVDVWLPICGEPLAVLANTWSYVSEMAAAYPGTVRVYVLDDGDDLDAARLAALHGFWYLVRPDRGWFKKAGNLRHAYHNSDGEFAVIFDADFAPRSDFLAETLPYLQKDPSVGIVQTPQYFRWDRRQTWMERGASSVQELFYRVVQVSRDRFGAAICVGSCAVYRRAALDSIGGTALIEHSEDVHTGFDLAQQGWRLRYIPLALAAGMCPGEPDAFLTQQYRWCSGSMSLLTSTKFRWARLRPAQLCCYLSGFCYYIHTAAAAVFVPLIPIALLAAAPGQVQLRNYLWIAPSAAYTLVVFPLWNRVRFGPTALMAKGLYGWAHLFAIVDIARGRRVGWHATGARTSRPTRRIWRSLTMWGGFTAGAWVALAVVRMLTMRSINFAFLAATGVLYGLTAVVMPLAARRQTRAGD